MRYAQEGYTTRSDLTIADPTSFDLVDILTNAVGLPSTDINQIKWTRGQQVEIQQWFSSESGRITRGYKNARADKDRAAQAQYRDEFRELQRSKDRVRPFFNNSQQVLKRQSVSTLLKSPRRQRSDQRRLDSTTGR
jgi:aryl-alcohol dehydrogenase-like predicted oxidoreductase